MTRFGASLGRALRTVEDYEKAARDAHAAVKHVKVIAAATNGRIPAGQVEVRVQGAYRRRLPDDVVRVVQHALVARHPVTVRLKVSTRWA